MQPQVFELFFKIDFTNLWENSISKLSLSIWFLWSHSHLRVIFSIILAFFQKIWQKSCYSITIFPRFFFYFFFNVNVVKKIKLYSKCQLLQFLYIYVICICKIDASSSFTREMEMTLPSKFQKRRFYSRPLDDIFDPKSAQLERRPICIKIIHMYIYM